MVNLVLTISAFSFMSFLAIVSFALIETRLARKAQHAERDRFASMARGHRFQRCIIPSRSARDHWGV
jgi:hypothetical protein